MNPGYDHEPMGLNRMPSMRRGTLKRYPSKVRIDGDNNFLKHFITLTSLSGGSRFRGALVARREAAGKTEQQFDERRLANTAP